MNAPIQRLSRWFGVACALVALALGYWGVAARGDLLARPDNPRNVSAEQRIQRGAIFDRDGATLAETVLDADGVAFRRYPHLQAVSAVGYYSLRFGVGGVEAEFDPILRGTQFLSPSQAWIDRALHRPQRGGDARLTLDLAAQQAAADGLNGHKGAAVAIDAANGDVLALASAPSYDPNQLDEQWDALVADPDSPLLNRATQGLYQAGTAFLPITLGEALNAGLAKPDEALKGGLAARIDSATLPCAVTPSETVDRLDAAFVWGCPAPFQALGALVGENGFATGLDDFGLATATLFDLPTLAAPETARPEANPSLLAVGQSDLTVTPLHLALAAAAFANHGQMPAPRLVAAIRPPGGDWEERAALGLPRGTISPSHAQIVADLMRASVHRGAAHGAEALGADIGGVCGLAIRGTGRRFDTWFVGFGSRGGADPVSVAVLIEDTQDCAAAARAGRDILLAALRVTP